MGLTAARVRSVQAFGIQGERQHSDAPAPPPAVGLHGLPDGIQDGNGAERQGPAGQSTPRWAGGEAERAPCRRRSFIPHPFPIGRGGRRGSVGKRDGGLRTPGGDGPPALARTWPWARASWPAPRPPTGAQVVPGQRWTRALRAGSHRGGHWRFLGHRQKLALFLNLENPVREEKKRIVPCSERVHKAPVLKLVSPG